MATRFYFESWANPSSGSTGNPVLQQWPEAYAVGGSGGSANSPGTYPAADSSWEKTSGLTIESPMWITTTKMGSPRTFIGNSENVATNPYDVLFARWFSAPLDTQTISGNVKGQFRARQNNAAADYRAQVVIRVIAPDGSVRGTLLASDGAALSSEFAVSSLDTTMTNRKFPLAASSPATLTNVNAVAGDVLCIEVGFRSHNSTTTSYDGRIVIGTAEGADLPEDETTTTNTYDPWMEFSHNFTWQTLAPHVTGVVVQAVVAHPDPERFVTGVVVQAVVEQFWHGWDIIIEPGDDVLGIEDTTFVPDVVGVESQDYEVVKDSANITIIGSTGGQQYRSNHQYRQSKDYRA